ncbi:hypothetical protein Y717_18875 [Streptomyces scopuliridis RB72]|uniref:Uncharacterized protein n=1 Tax=Streptomyces scopuliridis RB72 TaxID=1440053 RepID=A0A2T7T791_9ACTN|nr:hypothetical protein Y717_18875 [Streptomyces scopuliridis RB72]
MDEPELRTDTDWVDSRPESVRESRPETERRDVEEREELREEARAEEPDDEREDEPRPEPLLRPPPVMPVGGEDSDPLGETTGARPQVSQYSSPPPMSSYEPSQPGRWHAFVPLICPPVGPLTSLSRLAPS